MDKTPDEDQIPEETYFCPRWYEIKQYLIDNSAPTKLAISTMGMLSEPGFLRYIRDCGGLEITPQEFRNFLGAANVTRELFLFVPSSSLFPLGRAH
jgi:hypothetical protein